MSEPRRQRFAMIESAEQPEWRGLDALVEKVVPATLDPRVVLREHLSLPEKLVEYLQKCLGRYGLEFGEGITTDRYEGVERKYTRARRDDLEVALLHVPKWILKNGSLCWAFDELRLAFEGQTVRIFSPGCDAPCLVLAKRVLPEWQRLHRIDARSVVWDDLKELENNATPKEVLHLDLDRVGADPAAAPAAGEAGGRTGAFISYSHEAKDAAVLERLKEQLKPLLAEGDDVWDDSRIEPGDRWEEEIAEALARAKVAVLLVSKSFLASDFITENELPPLLKAAGEGGCRILWMVLDACHWDADTEAAKAIRRYQALHDPKKRLDGMKPEDQEEVLVEVSKKIVRYLRE